MTMAMRPILSASLFENFEIIKYLVSKGCSIENRANDGTTPFILSIANLKLEMMKYFYSIGANPSLVDTHAYELTSKFN